MKNTFEHINNLINKKEQYTITSDDDFVPYMIQRWISMVSPQVAFVLNETSNSQFSALTDKQMWHDYFLTVIPRLGYKKIKYLKKEKQEVSKDISEFASKNEISIREAKEILDILGDKNTIKKDKTVEVYRKRS